MNLREDRLLVIEKQLTERGRVVSTELAEMLSVPVDMIRRDLRDLAARGVCRRVYGGAVKPPVATSRSHRGTPRMRKKTPTPFPAADPQRWLTPTVAVPT